MHLPDGDSSGYDTISGRWMDGRINERVNRENRGRVFCFILHFRRTSDERRLLFLICDSKILYRRFKEDKKFYSCNFFFFFSFFFFLTVGIIVTIGGKLFWKRFGVSSPRDLSRLKSRVVSQDFVDYRHGKNAHLIPFVTLSPRGEEESFLLSVPWKGCPADFATLPSTFSLVTNVS